MTTKRWLLAAHGREEWPKLTCYLLLRLPHCTYSTTNRRKQTKQCIYFRRAKTGNQPKARGTSQLPNKQTLDDETSPIGSAAGLRLANGRALLKKSSLVLQVFKILLYSF
jgi:hypothetical protein